MRTPRQHADRNMSNAHNVSAKCPFTPAAFKRRLSSRRENLSNLAKCWRRVSRCKVKWKNPKKSCLHFLKHDPIYRVTSCTFMSAHRLESERRNKLLSMSTQFFVVVNLFLSFSFWRSRRKWWLKFTKNWKFMFCIEVKDVRLGGLRDDTLRVLFQLLERK